MDRAGAPLTVALTTIRVGLDAIHPNPENVRLHPPRNIEAIKRSLERFGQAEPLVVQRSTGMIIGGNGRYLAMRELGWAEADVVEVDVDMRTAIALGVALNRTAELAEWDDAALARILTDLKASEELANVGFDPEELDRMLADLRAGDRAGQFDAAEALTAAPELKQEVRRGEVWALGRYAICPRCGGFADVE